MPRDAAAVLLTRGADDDTEVFLVERSPELRFFGGYWALPGGVRAPDDGDDVDGDDRPALRRCALRELFEETGVLLDSHARSMPRARRDAVRRGMLDARYGHAEDAEALTPADLLGRTPAEEQVRDLCRITTPPFAPVRYDTLFVHAELPLDAEPPEVWPGELVQGRFFRPQDVLLAWRRGELLLVPPLVIVLEHWVAHPDRDSFAAALHATADGYLAGRLHRVRFVPGVVLASLESPTLPPATTTNCYVVGHDRVQVVDPAAVEDRERRRLFDLLDELVAEGARLDGVLVTHHHRDHVGSVAAVSQRYDLPVHAHPLTLDRLPEGFRRGRELADGDRIALGRSPDGNDGWELQAIHTPGHDLGHLCFRESRYQAVLVGDMLSTVSTIVIDPPEGHLATYLASLQRLLGEPMGTLCPAHGPAMAGGHRLIEQYLRHRRQREQKLVAALADAGRPATADELLPVVYWDVDRRMHGIAARSLAAGLIKLEEDGIARCDGDGRWHLVGGASAGG